MKPSDGLDGVLAKQHRKQIARAPWPNFEGFEGDRYLVEERRTAARQWLRRAREEYGSVHEFSLLLGALTRVGAPTEWTGILARLITDEARHVELCRSMACALVGEEEVAGMDWSPPTPPFPAPPTGERVLAWAADVVLCTCCIGETVSVPLYESLATVTTDPVARAVVEQIRRDELLHSRFGWEALEWLLPRLKTDERAWLEARLAWRLGGFERTCSAGQSLADLVGKEVVIEAPSADAPANLGHQEARVYATVFYATLEHEILPRFEALGFDAMGAWAARGNEMPAPLK
ncbi:MAG: hypothetical protein ACI9KE_002270 [Polyangiales bacterium]|jgi:hypothetical protein